MKKKKNATISEHFQNPIIIKLSFSLLRHRWPYPNYAIPIMPFTFRAPQRLLNNLALIVPDEVYFIMLGSLCDKVRVAQSLVFCVVFCRSLFVLLFLFHLSIVLFVFVRYTASNYPFHIFKLFLWLVGIFLWILGFPPPIILSAML